MKILLIDRREDDEWKRADDLELGLTNLGHLVTRALQVDGSNATHLAGPWTKFREAAGKVVAQYDVVLVHVGESQNYRDQFLSDCCAGAPTLCFAGTPPTPQRRAQCRKAGIHVAYPRPLVFHADPQVCEEIGRWLNEIETAKGDRRKIQQACERLGRFDPTCEDAIELLNLVLCDGDNRRITELTDRLKLSGTYGRDSLTDLRNQLFPEL